MALTLDQKSVIGGGGDFLSVHRIINYDTNSSAAVVESEENVKELHCSSGDLLGAFGLFVQGLLAFLAFTCLIGECVVAEKSKTDMTASVKHSIWTCSLVAERPQVSSSV